MSRHAALDIGTNSVKLHVAERTPAGWRRVLDRVEITRLGQQLKQTGRLQEEAMERTLTAMEMLLTEARAAGAGPVAAVGTMALRTAANAADFIERARARCDLAVEVIPGEEEARLSFRAVAGDPLFAGQQVLVFDVGGGSTEFIFGGADGVRRRSLDMGAVRFTEEILTSDPVTDVEFHRAATAIDREFRRLELPSAADPLVGIGGTPTTLAAVHQRLAAYDPAAVHGCRLQRQDIQRLIDTFRHATLAQRRALPGLPPKRADVILAGALIVQAVMTRSGAPEIRVSDNGLRHGLLRDRFGD